MKVIHISLSQSTSFNISYDEVVEAIRIGQSKIVTTCTIFFDQDYYHEYGYEIIAYRNDKMVIMSKLVNGEGDYTSKDIKPAHNTARMLIAGAFEFQ